MALEIREIIIRAITGGESQECSDKNKSSKECKGSKMENSKQETVDAISEIFKNEKER